MRTTMVGIGPSSDEYHHAELEPVYLLTRKRVSSYPAGPVVSPAPEPPPVRAPLRSSPRIRSIRFVGGLGVALALSAVVGLLEHPKGRQEVLSWVTLGHPDQAAQAGRRIESVIERLRHR